MSLVTHNSAPVYHIRFSPPDKALDSYWRTIIQLYDIPEDDSIVSFFEQNKPSDLFTHFTYDVWIDKITFLIQKATISTTIRLASFFDDMDLLFSFPDAIPLSFTLTMSDYGKDMSIDIPQDALDFDSYFQTLFKQEGAPRIFSPL